MWTSKLMWIVWPAFLAACALELVVFALVDPLHLQWSGQELGWSRQSVYTLAFFVFWCVGAVSGALTTLLRIPGPKLTDCSTPPGRRPDGCPQR